MHPYKAREMLQNQKQGVKKSEKQCHIIRDSGKYMFLPCPIGRVGPPRLALCLSPFPFAVTISHKKYTTINVIISLLSIWISISFNLICICICRDLGASREALVWIWARCKCCLSWLCTQPIPGPYIQCSGHHCILVGKKWEPGSCLVFSGKMLKIWKILKSLNLFVNIYGFCLNV